MSNNLSIAFFGETHFPAHNIKWINHIVSEFPVDAIVITFKDMDSSHISDKVKVYKILDYIPVLNRKTRKKKQEEIRKILKEHNVQLLHFLWGVNYTMWAKWLGHNYIITTRGSDVLRIIAGSYIPKTGLRLLATKRGLIQVISKRILRSVYLNASAITSTSYKQQKTIKQFAPVPDRNLHIIRTGVILKEFSSQQLPDLNAEAFVVFSPRTMDRLYNQHVIVEAFKEFIKTFPKAELRMIDNNPDSDYSHFVRNRCTELNISANVTFLPSLSSLEMKNEYVKSSMIVMIPGTDGTPVSAIEGMLTKRPVIMGNYDYDNDLFNEETVWFTDELVAEHLNNVMLEVRKTDHILISEKIEKAYKVATDKADRSKEMKRLFDLYNQIVNN